MSRDLENSEEVQKLFNESIRRFSSLEAVATILKAHPIFTKVNRSTIHRWKSKPSRSTLVAIDVLNGRVPAERPFIVNEVLGIHLENIEVLISSLKEEIRSCYRILSNNKKGKHPSNRKS